MGTPPEDETGDAPSDAAVDRPAQDVKSVRANALASRIDAFMADDDDDKPKSSELADAPLDVSDLEEVDAAPAPPTIPPPTRPSVRPVVPPLGKPPPLPPRGVVAIPPRPPMPPLGKPPSIPMPRASAPVMSVPTIVAVPSLGSEPSKRAATEPPAPPPPRAKTEPPVRAKTEGPAPPRTKTSDQPATPRTKTSEHGKLEAAPPERMRRPSTPPYPPGSPLRPADEDVLSVGPDITKLDGGGIDAGTMTPNIVIEQPLEAQLEQPTVVDKALAALGDAGGEERAAEMTRELESLVLSDPMAAANLAYELGELYERRLADEARAVKAYGRALNLDPSLRANLWAIRRVFYRRALWPNLLKLVDAEVAYARDDYERADLLLEKARIAAHHMNEPADARAALDEAVRIAPSHQGALLELERVVAKSGDMPALLDVWERLAEAVEHPARKVAYWLEVGRAAGAARDVDRANEAFDKATQVAAGTPTSERVARERLRVVDETGTPADIIVAIDALAAVLLAAFGPAGPGAEPGVAPIGERPDRATALRHELVALRRRQAQLVRAEAPDKAWELLQQASVLAPGESIVLSDLTELAEELGRYDDLAELVQSWQAVEADPSRGLVLSIRRADALLRGGQRDQARALLASLEATAPGFIVLSSAAERDALGRADVAELAKTYLGAAHAALLGTWIGPGHTPQPDPQAAAALFIQSAELLAYEIGTPEAFEEAHAALGRALEAVPRHPAAIEALTELDDAFGQIDQALVRLRDAAAGTVGEGKRPILERAIRLARGHGDLEAVLALEREVRTLSPNDLPLMWRLEATLAQLGHDEERATLLVEIAAQETEPARRGTALFAAARLRERAGAVEPATDLYRQVLAVWPDDGFARESLIDLLRAQERWQELVTERRAEAKTLPDGPGARRALREAAWILEVRLDDAAQAAQVFDDWLTRIPDDRTALEGLARCRAAFNDRSGEVAARQTIADADPTVDTQWLLARALERAGKFDEAADLYRSLMTVEEPSVAGTAAALALGDLAAARGDTVMRVESTAALAGRVAEPRLGAALAEDSGWMYALVLEDFDRAAQSFEAAVALDASRRGALLGAALVAARRGDPPALALAYEGLASMVQMPEAAAALLLRSSALAAAAGDLEVANQRVAAARIAAPDDTSALLVVAETQTIPVVDGSDLFAAVDPLLARAEILELRSALADDPASRASWELDRAEALELAGRLREAGAVVAAVLRTRPDDLRALAALRRMATRANDKATAAQASFALARVLGDRIARLELLREAAAVFDAPGLSGNTDYAVAAYKRIVAVDEGAPELGRLLELLRERADVRTLIQVITDRLAWLDTESGQSEGAEAATEAMAPLLLERATVMHGLGDGGAAMADLDVLLERAPEQVEALRFRADLALNAGDVDVAVSLWRRYLAVEKRPNRRGAIELQLAQVLAENTGDIAGAIEQLERVVEANQDDPQLRERLLGLCLRTSDWERAIRELRQLIRMRTTPQDKAREELRLGLMLRDRLNDRVAARLSLDRARSLDPLNLDVVRELADLLEPSARAQMLSATTAAIRTAIAQSPGRGLLYERLAQVNAWEAAVDARWVALVAVEALATPAVDQRQVLAQGRQQLGAPARVKLDDLARAALRGSFGGPLAELWRAIAPAVQIATGVDATKLGFARGDKLAIKKLGDKYEPLASALASFAIDDVEVYISAGRAGFARALAGETPVLCLGADIAAASTPTHRFQLGRAVATIAEGVSALAELRDTELEWTIVAALKALEAQVPAALAELVADQETAIAERAKVLKKQISRKARGVVQQLAQQDVASQPGAIDAMRQAGISVGHRAGLVWSGDLAVALSVLDVGKGGRSINDAPAALDLVAWSVSDQHMKLREKLVIALKGQR